VIYRCDATMIKIPITFLTEIKSANQKSLWKQTRAWIAKAILSIKLMLEVSIPDFILYCRATENNN
jgi:hypothetical protein